MRKLDHFDNSDLAERFVAYLDGCGVAATLRPEPGGGEGLWILNEDQLPDARDELATFRANPNDARYHAAAVSRPSEGAATEVPEADLPRRSADLPAWRRLPVTVILIGTSVLVTAVTLLSGPLGLGDLGTTVRSDLSIVGYEIEGDRAYWYPGLGLADVRSGELWRLVTPIFPHGDPLHLLFNMAWLWLLGGAIESARGSLRLLILVLVTAIASNLAEYFFNLGFTFDVQNGLRSQTGYEPDPFFLGMSGVVFGLFGFIWMRARLLPASGFMMPRDMVVWLMVWLVVCTTGLVGPIANVAHGVGLVAGMIVGAAPRLWRRSSERPPRA